MDARAVRVLLCCFVVLGVLVGGVGSTSSVLAVSASASGSGVTSPTLESPAADSDVSLVDVTSLEWITSSVVTVQEDDGEENGDSDEDESGDEVEQNESEDDEPSLSGYDQIGVDIEIHGNGSATWEVEYRYRLDDGNESVDWDALREDVDDRPEVYTDWFADERVGMLTAAENETDREMSMSNFAVETDDQDASPQEYGKIRFAFMWSSFAHVEVNRIEVGDALSGFMMDERMNLVLTWPEEYEATSIEPTPDDRRETAVIWYGEETQEFVDDEPRLDLIQTTGENNDSLADTEADEGLSLFWLAGLGALLLAGLAVVGWWLTRESEHERPAPEPTVVPPTEDDRDRETGQPEAEAASEPPLELLSNEEHVMRLLEEHGGRIKQQEVVAELDWTAAKTSQVVNEMREGGAVDVFRIGRENVITLPDDGSI